MDTHTKDRYAPVGTRVRSYSGGYEYTVLDHVTFEDWRGESVTVRVETGHAKGAVRTHSTPMDWKRDRVVSA